MTLKDYVTLGRSGLRVSPLCLGAMTFGTEWDFGTDEKGARALFDSYLERGGNFLDTADGCNDLHRIHNHLHAQLKLCASNRSH